MYPAGAIETNVQFAILKTLSYFQVFHYPLTVNEIWKFLPARCDYNAFKEALQELKIMEMAFETDSYYSLYNDPALIERRKEGNKLGKEKLKQAMLISRFIGSFPFVEAVCISGSLSKDFALADSDLDYFIITAPNRLWIARNLLHCFRKLTFLFNAQDNFCMNYFISLKQPEINPKNFYTAIELATLKTAYSRKGINDFVAQNSKWVAELLPNIKLANNMADGQNRKWIFTRCFESIVNLLGGDKLDKNLYTTTIKRWTKKWNRQGYDVETCMQSVHYDVNTPVNYPLHLPNKIMQDFEAIYKEVQENYYFRLSILNPTTQAVGYY